ncbi:MAG: ORF6N domain-containing protein [Acetobacter sp.]|uniref:ORF6N domain-containing protein n=1 Tax=Acetobacter sp. TaxID=440 RepID=UPI003F93E08E
MTQITINNHEVTVVEYKGQRVITFKMMDELHGRPEGTARKRFNDNKDRLTEGDDYWKISASEIRTHKILQISAKVTEDVTLLTEAGYSTRKSHRRVVHRVRL